MSLPLGAPQYSVQVFGNGVTPLIGFRQAYNPFARTGNRYGGGGTSGGNVANAPFAQGTNPLPIIRGRRRGVLPIGGGVATASVVAGGANYNTGDTLTLTSTQNFGRPALFRVISVTAGAVTGVQVLDPGSSQNTAVTAQGTTTSGTGAGATLTSVLQTGWLGPAPNAGD